MRLFIGAGLALAISAAAIFGLSAGGLPSALRVVQRFAADAQTWPPFARPGSALAAETGAQSADEAALQEQSAEAPKASAPRFSVLERKNDVIENYPCSRCHEKQVPDARVREMEDEHKKVSLNHGGGRFWCLNCHGSQEKDYLTSRDGTEIDFDESYRLCGECHYDRQRDWSHGIHGKRVGAWISPYSIPENATELLVRDRGAIGEWRGERFLLNCTECHNPHQPKMGPFAASPPPPIRHNLKRPEVAPAHSAPIWTLGKHLAPVGPGAQ